jgi:tetratricopeptide (TPR) repeat protein
MQPARQCARSQEIVAKAIMIPSFRLISKERLTSAVAGTQRPVALLVGSPLSLQGTIGVPAVGEMLVLARQEVEARDKRALPGYDDELKGKTGGTAYQAAMEWLATTFGQDAPNNVIREAVLRARKPGAPLLESGDGKPEDWNLPPGMLGLGKLVASGAITGPVLTTNFDPLISLAIQQAAGRSTRRVLVADGSFGSEVEDAEKICQVVHLHGFWRNSDTMHTPGQLTQPRKMLGKSLQHLLKDHTLVVVAYSGWDDVFTAALADLINDEQAHLDVIWCFYGNDAGVVQTQYATLLKSVERAVAMNRFRAFGDIDCHQVFDDLLAYLQPTPMATGPAATTVMPPVAVLPVVVDAGLASAAPAIDAGGDAAVVYGRDALLSSLGAKLAAKSRLVLHGFSGTGKTALIKALYGQPQFAGMKFVDIHSSRKMTAGEVFRRLLNVLQSRREDPEPPSGSLGDQIEELKQLYPHVLPAFVWVNDAHLLLNGATWHNAEIDLLLQAMSQAFPEWKWVFELNEKPEAGSFSRDCTIEEVPGLDKEGLSGLLAGCAPSGSQGLWSYSGIKLTALYQWLGGGQGGTAHTLAAELLATVAREQGSSPYDVFQNLRGKVIERLDETLLSILHDEVLGIPERKLLKVLSLYRNTIPQDHADWLEDGIDASGAWQRLRKRGLLPLDTNKDHYLHGFITSWVREKQMDLDDIEVVADYAIELTPDVMTMHVLIADCFRRQVGRQKEEINFYRANEAFYHFLCANEAAKVEDLIDHLAGKQMGWSVDALWTVYHRRRDARESTARQQEILQLLVNINPRDHRALRFLGECFQKTIGAGCLEAQCAFERALELNPSFPPYLADLGKTLLARGQQGAKAFIDRLETHRKAYPKAIDGHVSAIEADCLDLCGKAKEASELRQAAIHERTSNPAFYNDEAQYQSTEGRPNEALRLLNLAAERGCTDAYTDAILAQVLEKLNRGPEASTLRLKTINKGTAHPVFYVEEAKYQQQHENDLTEALRILDLARDRGESNHYTEAVRAQVLAAMRQE